MYKRKAYNQEKVDRGDGKVLLTHIVREQADGRFNVAATAEDLLRWLPSHYRTEKPVVHVSLNPAPEDRLDAGPVSYTHLDVYKRQAWRNSRTIGKISFCNNYFDAPVITKSSAYRIRLSLIHI